MEIEIYCAECGQQLTEASPEAGSYSIKVAVERCPCQDDAITEEAQKQGFEDAEHEFSQR